MGGQRRSPAVRSLLFPVPVCRRPAAGNQACRRALSSSSWRLGDLGYMKMTTAKMKSLNSGVARSHPPLGSGDFVLFNSSAAFVRPRAYVHRHKILSPHGMPAGPTQGKSTCLPVCYSAAMRCGPNRPIRLVLDILLVWVPCAQSFTFSPSVRDLLRIGLRGQM